MHQYSLTGAAVKLAAVSDAHANGTVCLHSTTVAQGEARVLADVNALRPSVDAFSREGEIGTGVFQSEFFEV